MQFVFKYCEYRQRIFFFKCMGEDACICVFANYLYLLYTRWALFAEKRGDRARLCRSVRFRFNIMSMNFSKRSRLFVSFFLSIKIQILMHYQALLSQEWKNAKRIQLMSKAE